MTILFMYDSPLRPEAGGTERATKLVMDELARRGHTTIGLLHFNQDNPDEYYLNEEKIKSLSDFLSENHVDVVVNQIAFHYWLLKEFLAHGGQKWKDNGGKIVSFMHFDPAISYAPVKSYYRDFWQKDFIHKIKRLGYFFLIPKYRALYRKTRIDSFKYIYAKSDRYVAMSPSYIKTIQNLTGIISMDKACVITNMLTFPEVAGNSILDKKEKIVLVVSRLDENQKRISTILKVWESTNNKDWKLQIVGTGKDADYYKRMVEKRHIYNVEFLGHQNPWSFYQRAKLFLMTSPREGWGLTITESMQNGTVPIVLNTSEVFREIVREGVDGFLPTNEREMVKKLTLLMADDKLREEMAKAALEGATRFTPEKVGEQWNKMLNEI